MTTGKKVFIGVVIVAAAAAILRIAAALGLIGIMLIGSVTSKPEVHDDIENYAEYMSFSHDGADRRVRVQVD